VKAEAEGSVNNKCVIFSKRGGGKTMSK